MAIKPGTATITTDRPDTVIVVAASVFQGKDSVDIRNFFYNDSGELTPTKKGVFMSPVTAVAVYHALGELLKDAELI